MRKHVGAAVLLVLAVAAVGIMSGSAFAAARSCGKVQTKYPSGATHGYAVKVTKGTTSCAAADKLMTGVYLASGLASAGPNNTNIELLKSGWRCVFPAAPPGPVTCTKGKNKVRATPTV